MANVAADLLVHVGADIGDATKGLSQVGSEVDSVGKGFQKAGFIMAGGSAAIIGGLGAAVFAAGNFEQAIADVNAVADLTTEEMEQVSALALEIGKNTSFSATEGAAAIGELVRAGVPLEDVLAGAATQAAYLAEAGGVSIPAAAEVMANSMNMFGIAGKDAAVVADTFAAAANASAADVAGLAQGLAQGGPAAAQFGISLQDTVTALALFSNYGIQGSDAGTSLKAMLQRLVAPTDEAAAKMTELGINAFDTQGNFVGLEALAGQLNTAFAGMSEEQRNAALALIFGADASRVAGIMATEGAEGFNEMSEAVNDQGAAGRMAAKRMDTLFGSIEQLKGSLETALIVIGSGLTPAIREFSDAIVGGLNWFLELNPNIQKFVGYAAAAAAAALALGAGISLVIGFLGPAVAGLLAILSPLLLIAAAVVALYVAWETNFLGIRDITASVFDSVMSVVEPVIAILSDVANGVAVSGEQFAALPGFIQPFVSVLIAATLAGREFFRILSADGIGAALDALPYLLTGVIQSIRNLGSAIMDGIVNLDWGAIGSAIWNGLMAAVGVVAPIAWEIIKKLGDLTSALASWVWGQAASVAWGDILASAVSGIGNIAWTIAQSLGNLTGALAIWLWGQAASVNWAGILSSAAALAGDITGAIVEVLGNLTDALYTWVSGQASEVGWRGAIGSAMNVITGIASEIPGKLGDAKTEISNWWNSGTSQTWRATLGEKMNELRDIVSEVPGKLGDLATELKNWYDNAINNVNWGQLGVKAGEAVGELATTLGTKGAELVTGLKTAIENADWAAIATAIGTAILALPAAIIYVGATMTPKAGEFIGGFLTGLTGVEWEQVKTWLADLGPNALAAVPVLSTFLLVKGQELISGILQGLVDYWPDVSEWLKTLGTKALESTPGLTTTLLQKGIDLLIGVFDGLEDKWPAIQEWLADLTNTTFEAVGDLSESLLARGVELIVGLITGAANKWPEFKQDMIDIGPAAFAAVGSLAKTLYNRGVELLQGAIDGAAAMWVTLQANIAAIGPGAVEAIGDLSDSLYGAGQALIQGAINGMESLGQAAYDAAAAVIGNAVQAAWDAIVPGSPSKITTYLGEMFSLGLAYGIDREAHEVEASVDSLFAMMDRRTPNLQDVAFNAIDTGSFTNASAPQYQGLNGRGTTIVYQTNQFDIHVDELEDIVEAGRFVRDLDTARTLYTYGVA